MAIRFFYAVVAAFSVVAAWLFVGRLDERLGITAQPRLASVVIEGVQSYEVDHSGVNLFLRAKSGARGAAGDEFYDFYGMVIRDGERHEIRADKAVLIDRAITLDGAAVYKNLTSGLEYRSNAIHFDGKNTISSEGKFSARYDQKTGKFNNGIINGTGARYDMDAKKLWIDKGVRGEFMVEE